MKTRSQAKNGNRKILNAGMLLAGAWVAGGLPVTAADPAPPKLPDAKMPASKEAVAEEPLEYNNWLEMSAGGYFQSGDRAQFQRGQGARRGAFGGVEDFHWETPIKKRGLFKVDGRALFDNHDYSLKLEVSHPETGYLRFGYREFRSWYDGSGGFFPRNNRWISLYDESLHVDRGEFWVEGGLTLPEKPQFTFRYSHQFRDGKKDSTSWGDSGLIGIANQQRGIVPTFLRLDEMRDIFEADGKHTLGNTDLGLGIRLDWSDINNSRNIHRRPGEAADRYVTQRDVVESDLFNVHASTETRLNDQLLLTSGYSYTRIDTAVSGSRVYGADYDTMFDPVTSAAFARRQQRDEGFFGLTGGSELNQYVMNLNLMFTPWDDFAIIPSLRVEKQDQDARVSFTETDIGAGPGFALLTDPLTNTRERGLVDVMQGLEARYTGWRNWSLYARGEWLEGQGTLKEVQRETDPDVVTPDLFRDTDSCRFTQKYAVGANWYPLKRANFAGQYYYKSRENDYTHNTDSTAFSAANTGNLYPAFLRAQDFYTHDVNFRVTLRPCTRVTLVSRYDFQLSSVDTQGGTGPTGVGTAGFALGKVQSAEMTSHILSQSATWSPLGWLYLQGNITYALDQTDTPAVDFASAGASLVLPAQNDYWNGSLAAGFALGAKTDLQAQYNYYRANNFWDNSAASQPYGAGAESHGVTLALIRQITKSLRWTWKYGFFENRDQTSGGNNNYQAHLVYTSVQYRF